MILVFAYFGWITIPGYLISLDKSARKASSIFMKVYDYKVKLKELNELGLPIDKYGLKRIHLPEPDKLHQKFNLGKYLLEKQDIKTAHKLLMSYLFLLITVSGFIQIGVRVITKVFINSGYWKTLKHIFIITLKTTIIVVLLQLFILKAYYIDITDPIGIGIMFSFLMSLFFTQTTNELP